MVVLPIFAHGFGHVSCKSLNTYFPHISKSGSPNKAMQVLADHVSGVTKPRPVFYADSESEYRIYLF